MCCFSEREEERRRERSSEKMKKRPRFFFSFVFSGSLHLTSVSRLFSPSLCPLFPILRTRLLFMPINWK